MTSPNALQLEKFVAGELSPAESARIDDLAKADPRLRARIEELRADDAATLAAHPPAEVAAEVLRRRRVALAREEARRPARVGLFVALPALAGAAALALWVNDVPRAPTDDGVRTKGMAPHLRLYLRTPQGPRPLLEGAPVGAHEVVQVAVVAPQRSYAMVVSIDGRGSVTRHGLPDVAPAEVGGGETPMLQSFELDDAPGFEKFFLVVGERPFDVDAVLEAARALGRDPAAARTGALPLPPGLQQSHFLLKKVTP